MTRKVALALLACAACYSPPEATVGSMDDDSSTGGATTSGTDPGDSTTGPEPTSISTGVDADTGSTTSPPDCETARFDRARFDEACFAP